MNLSLYLGSIITDKYTRLSHLVRYMRTFFNDPKKDKQVKQGTTAYLKFPVESEGSDLLSFLKSRVSKRASLEIRGFLQFEGVLVVVIIT